MSCTGKKGEVDTSGNEIYQLHCSSGSDTAEQVTLQYCILHQTPMDIVVQLCIIMCAILVNVCFT